MAFFETTEKISTTSFSERLSSPENRRFYKKKIDK